MTRVKIVAMSGMSEVTKIKRLYLMLVISKSPTCVRQIFFSMNLNLIYGTVISDDFTNSSASF